MSSEPSPPLSTNFEIELIDHHRKPLTNLNSVAKARKSRSSIFRACKTCQQKRVKCDGNLPCKTCARHSLKCAYSYNDRRWQKEKDTLVGSFQKQIHIYQVLLRVLKQGTDEQAQAALQALRRTSTTNEPIRLPDSCLAKLISDIDSGDLKPPTVRSLSLPIDYPSQSPPNELPVFACDPYHVEAHDPLSKSILTFRDMARTDIQQSGRAIDVIGSKMPNLELFFRPRRPDDPHTAWTWACELLKAYPVTLTMQLMGVFIAGLQMRFFIHPCEETYNDLPHWLRPTKRQYIEPHAPGVDFCALPPLKEHIFTNWDSYAVLLKVGHSPEWPYSDEACCSINGRTNVPTLSTAFLEHIWDIENHSVGKQILDVVPAMAPYVKNQSRFTRYNIPCQPPSKI